MNVLTCVAVPCAFFTHVVVQSGVSCQASLMSTQILKQGDCRCPEVVSMLPIAAAQGGHQQQQPVNCLWTLQEWKQTVPWTVLTACFSDFI